VATVYSVRLFTALALESEQSITCEAGFVTVLRDIDVVIYGNTGNAFFAVTGDEGQLVWYIENPGGTDTHYQWTGRQVFNPGNNIGFSLSSGSADITVSGYRLYLP
jgi:hypothetical protein